VIFPVTYEEFNISSILEEKYSLFPIRYEDKEKIRKWRNEQIALLRQKEILTEQSQESYFLNIVAANFKQRFPHQLLFGFFENDELIGYGGLVHIDWNSKNAEISFLLDTKKSGEDEYLVLFKSFLSLIQEVAKMTSMHKVYTFGYNLAKYRFQPLISSGFIEEANLKDHISIDGQLLHVKIYSKIIF
jgi:hypothetical protein